MKNYNRIIRVALIGLSLCATIFVAAQSKHFINTWGGFGYSQIYHGIDHTKVPGGIGYSLGAGYEYNRNWLLLSAGLEFNHLNSLTRLNGYKEGKLFQYPYDRNVPDITYWYTAEEYKEKHSVGYLNVPLQIGGRFKRYYVVLGVKVGLNLFGNYKTISTFETKAVDPVFIDTISNVPSHSIGLKEINDKGKLEFGLNISPGLEFGLYLDEWIGERFKRMNNRRNTNISYRAGVFVDYGLININTSKPEKSLVNNPRIDAVTGEAFPLDFSLNKLSNSTLTRDKRFGSLFAGIKFTAQFDLSKQRRPSSSARKTTQQTLLPFNARVVDAESNRNLDAEVAVRMVSGNRQVFKKRTDAEGMVSHELRRGRYIISAQSEGYSNYRRTMTYNKPDSILIGMTRIPRISFYVSDKETNESLQANIAVSLLSDSKPVFNIESSLPSGYAQHELNTGKYQIHVSCEGYINYNESVDFSRTDTLYVALQPAKKDVKVILHNLFFEFNSAIIQPGSEATIDDLYQFLVKNPDITIKIVGHTDNVGSKEYNQKLSENRAKAVYQAIVEKGIDAGRITWEGKGSAEPVTTNETEEGRAENRRVEFVIQ